MITLTLVWCGFAASVMFITFCVVDAVAVNYRRRARLAHAKRIVRTRISAALRGDVAALRQVEQADRVLRSAGL